ncbi:MAG: GNAT family N-acetyltransferase [Calditrichaeota bacterium]|nr:MAG: GNAT family N-acetyltransferase [Calditrichota bacterium]
MAETQALEMDFTIRKITADDKDAVVAIDAVHSGIAKPGYWDDRLKPFISEGRKKRVVLGYVAVAEGKVIGYVLAEARAWEFGSPQCGWIFAIGVDPQYARHGVALALCREVCLKFKSLGISTVRTMVRKDDVDVLSFFRASGFKAGPFIELELDLT